MRCVFEGSIPLWLQCITFREIRKLLVFGTVIILLVQGIGFVKEGKLLRGYFQHNHSRNTPVLSINEKQWSAENPTKVETTFVTVAYDNEINEQHTETSLIPPEYRDQRPLDNFHQRESVVDEQINNSVRYANDNEPNEQPSEETPTLLNIGEQQPSENVIRTREVYKHGVKSLDNQDQHRNENTSHVSEMPVVTNNENQRQLRVLSLGGSITWGSRLESRNEAYPYQIRPHSFVTNISVRASGSDYPALCLQSMIEDDLQKQGVQEIEGWVFDVVTIEYSLNGFGSIDLLLMRLVEKYPLATFIYIHLVSPRMSLRDKKTGKMPRDALLDKGLKFSEMDDLMTEALSDPSVDWIWDKNQTIAAENTERVAREKIEDVGGVLWSFPVDNEPKRSFSLFTADRHHLSKEGHLIVATGIQDILQLKSIAVEPGVQDLDVVGSWLKGDSCYSWFETGESPLDHHGGKMKMFVKPNKFAHHMSIGNGKATISFKNTLPWEMPVTIVHMVWHPQYYPKTKITIISNQQDGKTVSSDPFILHPIHPNEEMRSWHVTLTSKVGVANPGLNTVVFECLEKTIKPLRVTGIVLCGLCDEMHTTSR